MPGHKHFEELCALEASGRLDGEPWLELHLHCAACASCQQVLTEMQSVACAMALAAALGQRPTPVPHGMTSRFFALAQRAGIPLQRNRSAASPGASLAFAAAALLLLATGAFTHRNHFPRRAPAAVQTASAAIDASSDPLTARTLQTAPQPQPGRHAPFSLTRTLHPAIPPARAREVTVQESSPTLEASSTSSETTANHLAYPGPFELPHLVRAAFTGTTLWSSTPRPPQPLLPTLPANPVAYNFRYEADLTPFDFRHPDSSPGSGLTFRPDIQRLRFVPQTP